MTMNQYKKNWLISQLEEAIKALKEMPVQNDCRSCANFDIGTPNRCRAAGIAIPPEVIEVGCEAYIYDHTTPPF